MKKIITVMALMTTMVVVGLFASCEKDKNNGPINATDLIGKWELVSDSQNHVMRHWYYLEFKDDGTFIIQEKNLEDSHPITVNYQLTDDNYLILFDDSVSIKCVSINSLSGNNLTLTVYYFKEEYEDGNSYRLCNREESNVSYTGDYNKIS